MAQDAFILIAKAVGVLSEMIFSRSLGACSIGAP